MMNQARQTNSSKSRLEKSLDEYLVLAGKSGMRQIVIAVIGKIPELRINENQGLVFFQEDKPARVRIHRPISEQELNRVYDSIANEFEEGSAAIRQNQQTSQFYQPDVTRKDIIFKLIQGLNSSFPSDTMQAVNLRGILQAYATKLPGSYGTGKRR